MEVDHGSCHLQSNGGRLLILQLTVIQHTQERGGYILLQRGGGRGGGGRGGKEGVDKLFFFSSLFLHTYNYMLVGNPFKFFSITSIICQTPEEGGEVYIYTESEGI